MKYGIAMFVFCMLAPSITLTQTPHSPLVSTDWLKERIGDPDVVVVHVSFNRRDFAREHIPGARFAWWTHLVPSTPELSSELPTEASLDTLLEGIGVTDNSTIVIYFTRSSVTSATRALYTLQYYGMDGRAYMLDGGLEAWKTAGGKVTGEETTVRPGSLTLRPNPSLYAEADFIKSRLGAPGMAVVDARTKNFFEGTTTGNPRQGHIKGAVSIPFSTFVDSLNRFKPLSELRKMFHDAGVKDGDVIVPYCHVGQQATVAFQAAKMCGFDVRLYDGSMDDWSYRNEEYPMETSPEGNK